MFADNLSPTQTKAQYNKEYRAKRKERKHELIELYRSVQAKLQSFIIGFTCRRLLRSGEVKNLPHEYAFILKACEEFIDNPQRFPSLFACGGEGINNVQCRTLIAKV